MAANHHCFVGAVGLTFVLALLGSEVHAETAAGIAEAAYFEIKDNCFDTEHTEHARQEIARAAKMEPNQAWVHLAKAMMIINDGYTSGDRYDYQTYTPGSVEASMREALSASQRGPQLADVHYLLAELYTIKSDYKTAWSELDQMNRFRPKSFLHWSLRAQIYSKMGDYTNAQKMLQVASGLASSKGQKTYLNSCQMDIAKAKADSKTVESLYKENIRLEPSSPWKWGNFGHYLLVQGRPKEAIPYLEKAVQLGPYLKAEEDLAKARSRTGSK